jgi:hypothetical protein
MGRGGWEEGAEAVEVGAGGGEFAGADVGGGHAGEGGFGDGDFGAERGGVCGGEGHSKRATLVKVGRHRKIQPDIITESDTASASGAVRPRLARDVFGEILHCYTYSLTVAVTPVGLHE